MVFIFYFFLFIFFLNQSCGWWLLRWVCGGVGGLLIGFVVCVRGGGGLSQAITVGGCWLWRWCGFFFLFVIPGFFYCWIYGFVEFWLFLCVILVGF